MHTIYNNCANKDPKMETNADKSILDHIWIQLANSSN
jgi:hypothetical protein